MPEPAPDALLPASAREAFASDGYWVSPPLFDEERVAALRHAHERIWSGDFDGDGFAQQQAAIRQEYPPHTLRKLDNGWWVNGVVRETVTDPRIGAMAAELLGVERVRLWHDQVIYKPPASAEGEDAGSGNVGWHQDNGYWRALDTTNTCTVWIALQDTDLSNGGMRSIAGSQEWGADRWQRHLLRHRP